MSSPNSHENTENINDYLNDRNIFKSKTAEELCSLLDTKPLKPNDFDLFFTNLSKHHGRHIILDIVSHASVEYGNSISEVLSNINTLFHVLNIPLLLNMSKSIDSIFNSIMTNSILDEIRSIKNAQNQQFDEVKKKIDESKNFQNQNIDAVKQNIDVIKNSQNQSIDEMNKKIEDVSKNVKLQTSTENFNRMKTLKKKSNNFDKIYSIFEKIADEDDYISIKLAVESRYHEVTAKKDDGTWNIVTYGAQNDNFELVKMLVECGVNPSKNSPSGCNPVWYFCRDGNLDAVKYFCELPGANVNFPSKDNTSILHIASCNDYYDICEYLLSLKGVCVNMKSTDGTTALSEAKSNAVRDLLLSHGAKRIYY